MEKPVSLIATFLIVVFLSSKHKLVGYWIAKGGDGSKVNVDFHGNGTFKISIKGRIENEGQYQFYSDTILIIDKNCGVKYPGLYKIFFYNDDSARFKVICDSCLDRVGEIDGGVISRISNGE